MSRNNTPAALSQRREIERLQLAAAAGRAGIWDFDIHSGKLDCDARWLEILGLDDTTPISSIDDFKRFIHPDDVDLATRIDLASLAQLASTNHEYHNEFRIRRPDGEVRWLRSAACLVETENGVPGRAVGFVVDVTEAHRSEEKLQETVVALRDADARLRALNNVLEVQVSEQARQYDRVWLHSRDLQVVIAGSGVFLQVNPAWSRVLGHSAEEVVGRHYLDFVPTEDVAMSQQMLAAACRGEDLVDFEAKMLHRNGAARWVSWHTAAEGGVVFGYGRDVTIEREAKMRVRESEARLRSIFESSYQHQSMLDPDGILVSANAVALNSVGEKLEGVVGKPFWEAPWFRRTPGLSGWARSAVATVLAGLTFRQEVEMVLPSGRRRFDFTLRAIRDDNSKITAIVHEAVDLTEQRQVETALRQSQKMELIGQLAGGLAHDFGNLLQGIMAPLGLVRRLLNLGRPGEAEQHLVTAYSSVNRAKEVVQRLLALSRQQAPTAQPHRLDLLVRGMLDLLRRAVGSGVSIEMQGECDWQAAVDSSEFENVILNLCVNARDAMPQGGQILIRISAIDSTAELTNPTGLSKGGYLHLQVSDTGRGMEAETIKRAFDPFFTTKSPGKGTGLGLFMIQEFAQRSGGAVRIESRLDHGTTVHVIMPRHQ